MKKLNQFMVFDWERFAEGKEFEVVSCSPLKEYNTENVLGTKIEVVIAKDETDYHLKAGEAFSNLYEKLTFKVLNKTIKVAAKKRIVPVRAKVKAYGIDKDGNFTSYVNKLSITCDDVQEI